MDLTELDLIAMDIKRHLRDIDILPVTSDARTALCRELARVTLESIKKNTRRTVSY